MIKDFIYYWREYGFSIAWSFRSAIFWNWHEWDFVLPQCVDVDGSPWDTIAYYEEFIELGY